MGTVQSSSALLSALLPSGIKFEEALASSLGADVAIISLIAGFGVVAFCDLWLGQYAERPQAAVLRKIEVYPQWLF